VTAQSERNPTLDQWARRFRHLGQAEVYLPVVLGLLIAGRLLKRPGLLHAGRRAAIALLAVGLLGTGIKFAVGRVRPGFSQSPREFRPFDGPSSFPSGHTAAAFALAGSLALETSPAAGVVLLLGAGGTAWSRINDNKHWLSDVVSGAVMALLAVWIVHRRDRGRTPSVPPPTPSPP